jgi:hypothetical protein
MSDQIEALQIIFAQSDLSRSMMDEKLANVLDTMERLAHRMGDHGPLNETMLRVAQGQEALVRQMQQEKNQEESVDAESRMRLRSIDVQLLRLLEEVSAGRQETMAELRADLAALGRTLATGQPASAVARARNATQEREG